MKPFFKQECECQGILLRTNSSLLRNLCTLYIDTRPIHRWTKRKSFSVRNMFTIKNNYKKTAQKVFTKRECECQGVFIVKRFRTVKNLPVFSFYWTNGLGFWCCFLLWQKSSPPPPPPSVYVIFILCCIFICFLLLFCSVLTSLLILLTSFYLSIY